MTDAQWEVLEAVIRGERLRPPPVAFIVDSPWLPNWAGMSILDYFTSEEQWLSAHCKAIHEFPEAIFLPGFWAEFGMCTEPSAFGAKCLFPENEFPFAEKVIRTTADIARITKPDPRQDGLLPFVIKRLQHCRPRIEAAGHQIRFAVARGPLNIASFLMGSTELLMELKTTPAAIHQLLRVITDFLHDWLAYQRECFPTIDGVLLLDDIIGFLGEEDFREFAQPYFTELFSRAGTTIRMLHNDAPCRCSAPHLAAMGVTLYNMGVDLTLAELQVLTGRKVALLGNVPPRDVLANGTPADVARAVEQQYQSLSDCRGVIFSCGGGMPPGVPTENIRAFIKTVESFP